MRPRQEEVRRGLTNVWKRRESLSVLLLLSCFSVVYSEILFKRNIAEAVLVLVLYWFPITAITNDHNWWLKTTYDSFCYSSGGQSLKSVSLGQRQGVSLAGSFWSHQGRICFLVCSNFWRPPAFFGWWPLPFSQHSSFLLPSSHFLVSLLYGALWLGRSHLHNPG